jgi:AmmeMemoRadiSam system protein A
MGDSGRPATLPGPAALSADDRLALLRHARAALVARLGGPAAVSEPRSPALLSPRASFVTLTRRDTGALRGCRGEVAARRPLVQSVARMAVAAATDDPRFPPVELDELSWITITINALTPLAPLRPEEIEVGRHGLMLVVRGRSGLLLPEVPRHYGWDREEFLRALCHKAGVEAMAWRQPDAELSGFEAETWGDAPD